MRDAMDYETKHDDGDKTYSGLHPSMSVEEGQVDHGETTNDGLHRTLSPRMIHVCTVSPTVQLQGTPSEKPSIMSNKQRSSLSDPALAVVSSSPRVNP